MGGRGWTRLQARVRRALLQAPCTRKSHATPPSCYVNPTPPSLPLTPLPFPEFHFPQGLPAGKPFSASRPPEPNSKLSPNSTDGGTEKRQLSETPGRRFAACLGPECTVVKSGRLFQDESARYPSPRKARMQIDHAHDRRLRWPTVTGEAVWPPWTSGSGGNNG